MGAKVAESVCSVSRAWAVWGPCSEQHGCAGEGASQARKIWPAGMGPCSLLGTPDVSMQLAATHVIALHAEQRMRRAFAGTQQPLLHVG